MTYEFYKTCNNCKNTDHFEITRFEAAFKQFKESDFLETPCSKCNSTKFSSWGHESPEIDKQLLDIWGNDEELFFLEQDEDLLLANMDDFSMILEAIDEGKYLKSKINVLVESLCVLLYDNVFPIHRVSRKEKKIMKKNEEIILPELIKRKDKVIEAGKEGIDLYIRQVVFPKIGIID